MEFEATSREWESKGHLYTRKDEKTMSTMREIINPHDKMFIDCENENAACAAILIIGRGMYGIRDVMPVMLLDSAVNDFVSKKGFNKLADFMRSVEEKDIASALRSIVVDGEISSLVDIVRMANSIADKIEEHLKAQ